MKFSNKYPELNDFFFFFFFLYNIVIYALEELRMFQNASTVKRGTEK